MTFCKMLDDDDVVMLNEFATFKSLLEDMVYVDGNGHTKGSAAHEMPTQRKDTKANMATK